MNAVVWIALMLVVGLGVMALEVFVPSGGILGVTSALALVAAVAIAFVELGPAVGLGVLALVVVAVPAVLALAVRWFPETPLGRRVIPPPPEGDDVLPGAERRRRVRELVGRSGRAVGPLLPWGSVEFDGQAIDGLSESGPIEAGTDVEVVAVQGAAVVVRRLEPRAGPLAAAPEAPAAPAEPSPSERPAAPAGLGGLSPTLETFDFDRLEPPPA
jgi:membrane-bound ClpP family serine protease